MQNLVQKLVAKNSRIFLEALTQIGNSKNLDKNKINFEAEVLQILIESELRNRFNFYLNYKKDEFEPEILPNQSFINTPHPIGNLSATHGILLDFIARINNVELRIALNSDKNFSARNLEKYAPENLENYRNKQLKKFTNQILQQDLAKESELEKCANLDNLLEILAKKFVQIGLDIRVISKSQQTHDANRKINHLKKENSIIKNWDRVDADGDPDNNMTEIFSEKIIGKNFLEIYASHDFLKLGLIHSESDLKANLKSSNSVIFEPRISCKEKRGVEGLVLSLSKIDGVSEIKVINDILVEEIFERKYEKFVYFLRSNKYGKSLDSKNNSNLNLINSPLDLILRATLPNFITAHGLVLSDFPAENGEDLLAKLLFIKIATDKFLDENSSDFIKKPQIFLPLCENEAAINNLEKLIAGILGGICQKMQEICENSLKIEERNQKLAKLKDFFCHEGELIFGGFFGPSDLTADIGAMSLAVINNKKLELAEIYTDFQENIEKIAQEFGVKFTFNDIELIQEYGKGSSSNRGANLVFSGPRTIQGQALSSTDIYLQKIYDLNSSGTISNLKIESEILAQSVKTHRYFIKNTPDFGKITQEYNAIIETKNGKKLFLPTTKNYSNNQGTRGQSGLVKFENQRAIGLATFRSYFGLLQSPAFPYDFEHQKMLYWSRDSFANFVNHPAGFTILLVELFQFSTCDFQRAKLLGFSKKLIAECENYVEKTLEFLCEILEIKSDSKDNLDKIIVQLQNSNFIKSDYLKKRLELFSKQIPIAKNLSNILTKRVKKIYQEIAEENFDETKLNAEREKDYAAIGTYLNLLSNFQLPIISADS